MFIYYLMKQKENDLLLILGNLDHPKNIWKQGVQIEVS